MAECVLERVEESIERTFYLIKEREKGRGFGSVLFRSDEVCVGEGHFIP